MPNRIIKDSIRTSDTINSLGWFEECLFYRLIVSCDDYGRFDGRTAIIKGTCFPLKDSVTAKSLDDALSKLVTAGLVSFYEVDGKPYLLLPTWEHHQNVRARKSKYPNPEDGNMNTFEYRCNQMQTNCDQMQSDVPENPNPNTNPIRKTNKNVHACDDKYSKAFEELWSVYPRKREKANAYKCYKARLSDGFSEDELLTAVKRYADECKTRGTEARYIKLGATFLGPNTPFSDYLGDYKPEDAGNGGAAKNFNNFDRRRYDMDKFEKDLLEASGYGEGND